MKVADGPIIIVLGAPNDGEGRLLAAAEGRAEAAVREYWANPHCRVLLTGGFGEHFNVTPKAHYTYLANYLSSHGVPESAFIGKLATANTREDADMSAVFLSEWAPPLELRVITSDFHIARSRLLFERAFGGRAQLTMIPAPARLPRQELCLALRHEADSIERFL
jgi:uncharacterized SAM-binding protein YcdF (DUF218 family)